MYCYSKYEVCDFTTLQGSYYIMWNDIFKVENTTRRNLVLFDPHTFQLLSNSTTFQLHLAILNLQMACCIN
jgi:hypothetical protein